MLFSSYLFVDFLILFSIFWILLFLYFTRHFNHWKSKNIPFLKPKPFVGNILDALLLKTCLGEIFESIYNSSVGRYVGFFICDKPSLLVRDPELIKSILVKDFSHFYDRSINENKKNDPIGAHILFTLRNPDWKIIRTKITPVFTSAKMKILFKLILDTGNDMVDYLNKIVSENPNVDVKEICARYTTDVISSTSFGINANCFKDENSQFRAISRKMFDWSDIVMATQLRCQFIAPYLVKLFKMTFLDKYCTDVLSAEFWKIMHKRELSGTTRGDIIDILIQIKNNEKLQNDSIKLDGDILVAQTIQFFAAGFETTSSALTFGLYELAKQKDIQSKLREEINKIFKKYDGITYDCLKEMTYLEMTFKEILRKYPILPFLDRSCNADYKIPGTNDVIDKGTTIFIPVMGLHYNPEYYPDPKKFDPERFSEENVRNRNPFVYLPFGQGPRNCIGARFGLISGKLALAKLVQHFEIDISTATSKKLQLDPRCFLLAPYENLKLKFTKI